jgi:tetratricopeptide (TPR) repeat protein
LEYKPIRAFVKLFHRQKALASIAGVWYFTCCGGVQLARKRRKLTKRDIKEDEVAEFFMETVQYLRQNSKRILGIAIVAVVGVLITTMVMRQLRAAEREAQTWVSRANMELRSGNIASAIQSYEAVAERYRGTWGHSDASFFMANAEFAVGRHDTALVLFQRYLSLGKRRHEFTVSAKQGVAQCLEEMGRYTEAADGYRKVQREHPDSPLAPDALMGSARCYELAGDLAAAEKVYSELLEIYPDSYQSSLARLRLMETRAALENS